MAKSELTPREIRRLLNKATPAPWGFVLIGDDSGAGSGAVARPAANLGPKMITADRIEGLAENDALLISFAPQAFEELLRWREIALYLADCHAATAEYEGRMSRTSKSSKKRMQLICSHAAEMIRGGSPVPSYHMSYESDEPVLKRLDEAAKDPTHE